MEELVNKVDNQIPQEDEEKSLKLMEKESQKGWWLEDKNQNLLQISGDGNLDPQYVEKELTEKEQEM
jgi:hypothetical protein